ncbi:unnamed protein product, partial [marine sediment metagenome]
MLTASGLNPGEIDPRTIKIFNNGGTMLPENIDDERIDGLMEIAIRVIGEEDGKFDPNDYILFYGKRTEEWEWNSKDREMGHSKNVYAKTNLYWLTYGGQQGKRMQSKPYIVHGAVPVTTAKGFYYREDELVKMFESGNNWYMAELMSDQSDPHTYAVRLPGYIPGSSASFRASIYTIIPYPYVHISSHTLITGINNTPVLTSKISGSRPQTIIRYTGSVPGTGEFSLWFDNDTDEQVSMLYLDWFAFEYERNLLARDGLLKYFVSNLTGPVTFEIIGISDDRFDIYDITDYNDVCVFENIYDSGSETAMFSDTLRNDTRVYYAAHQSRLIPVETLVPQPNSFLRTEPRTA